MESLNSGDRHPDQSEAAWRACPELAEGDLLFSLVVE
jgi:hypothetical protein